MAKRAYILGAGFSKAVGMPLAAELTEPAIKRASYFDRKSKEHNDCYVWLNSFRRRLFGARGLRLSIEEVFHYAYFDLEAFKLYKHVRPGSRLASDAKCWLDGLQEAVIEEIWERQARALRKDSNHVLRAFAEHLSDDDVIITFNYDQLVEKSLESSGRKWSHGFEPEPNGLPILKLHGSIDWLIAKCLDEHHPLCKSTNCTVLYKSKLPKTSTPANSRQTNVTREAVTTSLLRLNSWELLDKNLNTPLAFAWEEKRPGIAALGAYKPLSSIPALGSIWRKACLYLHDVDEVVAIGFSFCDFDATASLQFGGVTRLRSENGKQLRRLTIIDPSAKEIAVKAKPIFSPKKVRAIAVPHEQFDWKEF